MIKCESCSSWSHSECVNVSPTVAANYPFICPYCVKSLFSSISVLTSDITQLKDRLVKLENTCKQMSTIISERKAVQDSLDSIYHKVQMLSCSAASSISIPTSNCSSEPSSSSTPSIITLPLPPILHCSSTASSLKFHPPYSTHSLTLNPPSTAPPPILNNLSIATPLNLHHSTAPPPILYPPSTVLFNLLQLLLFQFSTLLLLLLLQFSTLLLLLLFQFSTLFLMHFLQLFILHLLSLPSINLVFLMVHHSLVLF